MPTLILRVAAIAALILPSAVLAGPESRPAGIAARIWGIGNITAGQPGDLALSGTYLHPDPSVGGTQYRYVSTSTTNGGVLTVDLGAVNNGIVRVEPAKVYQITVGGQNLGAAEINIVAPPGYQTIIDGVPRTRSEFFGAWTFYFQIEPLGASRPRLGGVASQVGTAAVEWHTALGGLSNGHAAGVISLIDAGTRSDWSPLFTTAMLGYESATGEVWVYRVLDNLRQVISNEVAVDVVTTSSTQYEMRFYHPGQVNYSSIPRTFTGSPFATYKVAQGGTSDTLNFTKEIRDVTNTTSIFPVSRTETMSLARANSWPGFLWTRSPWTLQGQTPVSETTSASTGTGSLRGSEDISIHAPASSGDTLKVDRIYANVTGVGELVISEALGSGSNNLVSTYEYYTNTSSPGNLGYLKSTTSAGGGWEAYEYYDSGYAPSTRGGRVKYRFRPFVNSPSTVTQNYTQGEVTYFEYVNDEYGAQRNPSLIKTLVNNTETAKTTFGYNYNSLYANGHAVNRLERTDYTSATNSLLSVIRVYRSDWGDALYRGQIFSVTTPDNVRRSFAYETGTWNGSAFTAGSGDASRVSEITGSALSSAGTSLSNHNSKVIEQLYLVDGKSTLETTIRDVRALIVRRDVAIWSSGTWRQAGWTNFTYDIAGNLILRTSNNGGTYSATYTGGLKSSETDEQGVVSNYTYDEAGRVSTASRQGSGVIGTLVYKYSYDAAGNRTTEWHGWGNLGAIVASAQFDDAGRIISETPPGHGATTHSYNVSARSRTTTRADGATVVETANRDGELASITGTAVVPYYRSYGIESDGRRYSRIDNGTSSSVRWMKQWTDWTGRGIKEEHPGFTGQANIVAEYFYNTAGYLWKKTRSGYAAELLEYNALGQLYRSGLDLNGNNTLDLASSDRIAEQDSSLESYSGAYWLRTDRKAYAQLGIGTALTAQTTRLRLTNHPANRLAELQQLDAEGNLTTVQFDVNRSARTATRTEARSGLSAPQTTSYVNGLLRSVTGFDGLTTTTGYDNLLRVSTRTDSRNNVSSTTYQVGTQRPSFVTDASGAQTVFSYDNVGRLTSRRDPRNHYTRFSYNNRDQLTRQWGDGAHPVQYGYDSVWGQLTTMSTYRGGSGWDGSTWPSSPGTADTTTWSYDGPSGLLTTKTDALARAVSQTYNVRGQTATRTLARGVGTTYAYNNFTGELTGIDYSDTTPDITYTYTRLGQLDSVADATGTRDLVYDASKPWRLSAEALDAFFGSKVVTRLYENTGMVGRNDGFKLGATTGSSSDLEHNFSYTASGRFETITSGINHNATARTFRYGYLGNAALIQSLSIDGGHAFTVTRTYEATRDLIQTVESKWSTTSRVKYDFAYDERRMRTSLVQSGDVFADYGAATHRIFQYDGRGQVTADVAYLGSNPADQTQPLPGRRHEYAYENAGNRLWANHTGVSGPREDYSHNALNQIVTKENNSVASAGTTAAANAVTVDGAAAGRQGQFYSGEVLPPVSSVPSNYPFQVAITPPGQPTTIDNRSVLALPSLQSFSYDLDGNLTSDGHWDYTWDAENRLVRMATTSAAAGGGIPNREITFVYDYQGRRVQKRVLDVTGSWTGTDIGITNGSHSVGPPFTVTAAGTDIWGTSDEFRLVHQPMTGDGTIMATVTGLNNTDAWAKAGVMIRESLAAGARHASMLVTPSNNSGFQSRSSSGGSSAWTSGPYSWMPARLRLVRVGSTITGSISQDGGSTWTQVGAVTLSGLASTVYVGLAVTSHNTGTATTGTFTNISVPGGGGATEASSRRYLYDGWNLVAEFNAPGGTSLGTLVRTYTWGLDLMHSLSGSGGVGALLQIADHASGKIFLPTYDGNGNVAALLNASTGTAGAIYEYSPYGEPLRVQVNDAVLADQPFRFSTKFTDVETGLVYYGHRYYQPRTGRFLNRDPIEESGGLNLYGFCGNNGVNRWDVLGHSWKVEATDYGTFFATSIDEYGNVGRWNFDNRENAERYAQAWINADVSVVGDRVTDEWLADHFPSTSYSESYEGNENGPDDHNPFDLTLNIDGVISGTVSGTSAASYNNLDYQWNNVAYNNTSSGYGVSVGGSISPLTGQTVSELGPYWSVDFSLAPNNTPGLGTRIMNGIQTGLDVVGLIPAAGEIADGVNALVSLGRGDYKGAALSAGAMIPFAGWGATGAKVATKYSDELLSAAQKAYPGKAGVTEFHHVTPKYIGGAANGPTAPLDAAYHQQITNEFRSLWPYGGRQPTLQELQEVMEKVYQKYPLPPGGG